MRIGNWPLMMLAIEHVIRHPEEYDQSTWRGRGACGTTRCIAGWIAYWAGWADIAGAESETAYAGVHHLVHGYESVEAAALKSLEMDPELPPELVEEFCSRMFNGDLPFEAVLENLLDYARADGVTLTPVIMAELTRHGIIEKDAA